MNRPIFLTVLAAAAAVTLIPAASQAQIEVQIGNAPPPRHGAWGDRDRDGVPNAYDRHDNRRAGAWGDRDRDGVPNAYDRYDNRALRDRDRDGVPNAWDRNDRNPYRR